MGPNRDAHLKGMGIDDRQLQMDIEKMQNHREWVKYEAEKKKKKKECEEKELGDKIVDVLFGWMIPGRNYC
jgi:hypothetical protein